MKLYADMTQLIGTTPLMEFCYDRLKILGKLEFWNPAGSVKDRAALFMIEDARRQGLLVPGGTIVEPTSGNTGIALCAIASFLGHPCIITMPENMSRERQMLMKAYGAQVLLSPKEDGMPGAIRLARRIAESIPNAFMPGQFENAANSLAHEKTTGPEIWADTDGTVDIFVAGVGTGGTVTGVGRFLKARKPSVKIIAVEPAGSPVLTGGCAGSHGLQGIGAGFVPAVLDRKLLDEILCVTEQEARTAARYAAKHRGILLGISSGAALHAAFQVAQRPENNGKTVVTLLPDSGERYLSTDLFAP